jgi:hypothetical protein
MSRAPKIRMIFRPFEVVVPGFPAHELFDDTIFEGLEADDRKPPAWTQETKGPFQPVLD